MISMEDNIFNLFAEADWKGLNNLLVEFFKSSDRDDCEKIILYLDSCVEYFIYKSATKPSNRRYVRVVLKGLLDKQEKTNNIDIGYIEAMRDIINSIKKCVLDVYIQELLELLLDRLYVDPENITCDILTRHNERFQELNHEKCIESLPETKLFLDRYYQKINDEDWDISFDEHNYITKCLMTLYHTAYIEKEPLAKSIKDNIIAMLQEAALQLEHVVYVVDENQESLDLSKFFNLLHTKYDHLITLNVSMIEYGFNCYKKQMQTSVHLG